MNESVRAGAPQWPQPVGQQPVAQQVQFVAEESWDEPDAPWNAAPSWTAPPPRTTRRAKRFRRRTLVLGGLLLALVVTAGGLAYGLTRPGAGTTMRVSFVLTDDATSSAGCVGQGDDAAYRAGGRVTLGAPGGRRLAVAPLGAGRPANGQCSFSADFNGFPTTYDAYTISLANGPTRTVKRAELRANGWRVSVDAAPPTRQINGRLTLYDPSTYQEDCIASGRYSGLNNRPQVVVEDKTGRVIASGRLGRVTDGPGQSCEYDFVVNNVRADQSVYTVDVGNVAHLTQSAATVRDNAWSFVLQVYP